MCGGYTLARLTRTWVMLLEELEDLCKDAVHVRGFSWALDYPQGDPGLIAMRQMRGEVEQADAPDCGPVLLVHVQLGAVTPCKRT